MLPHAYYQKIVRYFVGDNSKAWAFLNQWQPELGDIPLHMIKKGREKKLMLHIDSKMRGISHDT